MNSKKAQVPQHANGQKGKTFFTSIPAILYRLCLKCTKHIGHILFGSPLRALFCLALLLALIAFTPKTKPLFIQDYPYTLRVVSPQNQRVFASLSPFGIGFEYDLVNLFASEAGYTVQWINEDNPTAALNMLSANKADLAVGFPDLEHNDQISAGPVHTHRPSVAVQLREEAIANYKAQAEAPTLDESDENNEGLARAKVNNQYLAELYDGASVITDDTSWALWQPFAQEDSTALPLDDDIAYRWYWNIHNDKLGAQVLQFWHDRNHLGDTVLADLNEHYFNFIPLELDLQELKHLQRVIKTRLPRYQKTINDAAKRYHIDPLLLTAVIFQESHFDPDAVSYTGVRGIMQLTQATADSLGVDRLNPQQSIEGGARYLRLIWDSLVDVGMGEAHRNDVALDAVTSSVTPDDSNGESGEQADGPNGEPSNGQADDSQGPPNSPPTTPPTPAITASTLASTSPELIGLTDWNRWCFTLAAFNQGRGHLRDAIRLSKALGGSGLTWYELKRIYPLMSQKEFYSKLRYGRCRGGEAVQFVDNIRWYYYLLSGAAVLDEVGS